MRIKNVQESRNGGCDMERKLSISKLLVVFFLVNQTFPASPIQAGGVSLKGVYGSHSTDSYSGHPTTSASIAVGDLDASSVNSGTVDTLSTNGTRKLFYLNH